MMNESNTIHFIHPSEKAADKNIPHLGNDSNFRQQKDDPYKGRFIIGGNRVDYPDIITTSTTQFQTVKSHLNSVIAETDTSYIILDIKDFILTLP